MLKIPDCYYVLEDYAKAHDAYSQYLDHFPSGENASWVYYQIANCHLFQEKFTSAQGAFAELLKYQPNSYWTEIAKWEMSYLEWIERFKR
jgi:outer membrane protein assembly factor BamD (BamD/ComL family)